jgi:adenylate cyclase
VDVRRLVGDLLARFGGANAVGAVVVFVYQTYVTEGPPEAEIAFSRHAAVMLFVAYLLLSLVAGAVLSLRAMGRALRWLTEDRRPTDEERAATVHLPYELARLGAALWLGAVVVFGVFNGLDGPASEVVRVAVGTTLGGLSTTALAFLLLERRLRPVVAQALADGMPETRAVGIRPRLLLAWALGSGIPLLGVAVAPVGEGNESPGELAVLASIGLASGGVMIAVVTRSLTERLARVRAALSQVQAGELDISLEVDEGGQLGLLQRGLNEMVAGLRERRHLQDLFGRHVGEEVARQALERSAGLGGEQREVSTLFIDVVRSTTLAATRPAGEVVAMLNDLFGAVVRGVAAEGGWVNKFEGDGALCVFGAPEEQPDHAARALRAARRMRASVEELRRRYDDLDAGIGVSSGLAVAGNIGAEERYEYTVVGDPVNEAARLTEAAKAVPERVLASAGTVRRAGTEAAGWRPIGTLVLRGRTLPTEAFVPPPVAPRTGYGQEVSVGGPTTSS